MKYLQRPLLLISWLRAVLANVFEEVAQDDAARPDVHRFVVVLF
jgi:hypothetical protein